METIVGIEHFDVIAFLAVEIVYNLYNVDDDLLVDWLLDAPIGHLYHDDDAMELELVLVDD